MTTGHARLARLAFIHYQRRSLRLADQLFTLPIIAIPIAQNLLDVAYHTAQHTIERFVQNGSLS